MARSRLLLALGLSTKLVYGANTITKWADLPIGGITTDTTGIWAYNHTQANDFVLKDRIFFANTSAKLHITSTISGDWSNSCGILFCLDGARNLIFNPGHTLFTINSEQIQGLTGYFQIQGGAILEINSNFSVTATNGSKFDQGVFEVKDATLHFINSDLSLDLSNTRQRSTLFNLSQNANVTINASGTSVHQKVILRGGIKLADTATFELNLSNQESDFEGFLELKDTSKFQLNLTNSQATLTSYNETLNGTGASTFNLNHSMLHGQIQGKQTDLNLSSNSTWNMFNQSEIRDLTLQDSVVDLMQNDKYAPRINQPYAQRILQGNSLSGGGTFKFYADLDQRQSDRLEFKNIEGDHKIQITYNPKTFTQLLASSISEQDNIIIASSTNPTQSNIEAGDTDVGLISYKTNLKKIQNAQTQWLISAITPNGYSTLLKVLVTALNTPYRFFDLSNSILNSRLGDLRNYPRDYGLYFRTTTGINQLKGSAQSLPNQEFWLHLTGGFDSNQEYQKRVDFFGIGLDATLMSSKHPTFSLTSTGYGLNLYYTSIFDHRLYIDAILKYTFLLSSFKPDLSFQTHLLHLGLEVGKKIAFGNQKSFFYAEPQAKLTSGAIFPLSIELNDQNQEKIQAKLLTQIPLIARSSLYFGYEWNGNFIGDFKLGGFIEYSLKNGGIIQLNDPRNSLNIDFKGDFDLGVSAIGSFEVQKVWRFYFGIDSSFLGNYTTYFTFNAGMRWSFGDRYIPPPPPIAPPPRLDRFNINPHISNQRRTFSVIRDEGIGQMKHYDQKVVTTQNRNKNRFNLIDPSLKNPLMKSQGQKEYNRQIKRDRFLPREK